jgi:hypothetical protein
MFKVTKCKSMYIEFEVNFMYFSSAYSWHYFNIVTIVFCFKMITVCVH